MGPQDSVRLFIAFRLPVSVTEAVIAWQRRVFAGCAGVRLLPEDHVHVTLVFLGSRLASDIRPITEIVGTCVSAARTPRFVVGGYRETSRVGMLTLREVLGAGDAYVCRAQELTGGLMTRLAERGFYRPEHRAWRPHITVARFRTPPVLTTSPPELAAFEPVDVALFESVLAPTGSEYRVLAARAM